MHLLDRETDQWRTVIEGVEATTALSVDGDRLLGVTNLDAPRGRVVTAPLDTPDRPGHPRARAAGGHRRRRARPATSSTSSSTDRSIAVLEQHHRDGGQVGEVTLPDVGTFAGFDADPATGVAFLQLESFTRPAGAASGHRATAASRRGVTVGDAAARPRSP